MGSEMMRTVATLCAGHNNACWVNRAVNSAWCPKLFAIRLSFGGKAVKPERLRLATAGLLLFWIVWW